MLSGSEYACLFHISDGNFKQLGKLRNTFPIVLKIHTRPNWRAADSKKILILRGIVSLWSFSQIHIFKLTLFSVFRFDPRTTGRSELPKQVGHNSSEKDTF